jgi:hypothetical protein
MEVMEYEYRAPEKPVIEQKQELKVIIETVKPARKPAKRAPRVKEPKRENGAFTGWTYNRLGTKQIKVCNW